MTLKGLIPLAKKIVRLQGPDTLPLLQGLLTNDVQSSSKVIYSYLLNSQGRVMFDLFLYKIDTNEIFLETDASLEASLIKVLNFYKMRRSVSIESSLYAACFSLEPGKAGLISGTDPRLPELGYKTIHERAPAATPCLEEYRDLRYRLGVPEGSEELGVGKTIPLEGNGDYLQAISFDKGCYIGQELAARTHHTGVVRKRYMPLTFPEASKEYPNAKDQAILDAKGVKVGIVKAQLNQRGLGLMRIKESLNAEHLTVDFGDGKTPVKVSYPTWWPNLYPAS